MDKDIQRIAENVNLAAMMGQVKWVDGKEYKLIPIENWNLLQDAVEEALGVQV